jgi:hypothetical protein
MKKKRIAKDKNTKSISDIKELSHLMDQMDQAGQTSEHLPNLIRILEQCHSENTETKSFLTDHSRENLVHCVLQKEFVSL